MGLIPILLASCAVLSSLMVDGKPLTLHLTAGVGNTLNLSIADGNTVLHLNGEPVDLSKAQVVSEDTKTKTLRLSEIPGMIVTFDKANGSILDMKFRGVNVDVDVSITKY